jgi:hypothetical protein
MNAAIVLDFANLLFGGMLAGMEFLIHYGLRRPMEVIDERSQVQLRQALVLRLRVLVPAFFVPAAVSGIATAILDRETAGFWFRIGAVAAMLVWMLIRVIGTVPINSATLTWLAEAPPKNWKQQIDSVERFHIVGVWAAVAAFAGFLIATALKFTAH